MKQTMKRILAIVCCIAVVLTGISANHMLDNEVQAASAGTSAGTISLNPGQIEFTLAANQSANGGTKTVGADFINIGCTTTVTDYSQHGGDFLTTAFVEEYITFGGGMTVADLMDGKVIFYLATGNILQFNWSQRSTTFTEGWFFTVEQGALIPYQTTGGATAYLALDKEYTFTFKAGDSTCDNFVVIQGSFVSTFSMGNTDIWGNAMSGGTQIAFASDNIVNWAQTYTYIHNDESYEDYICFTDLDFGELEGAGVKIRYILDGMKCIQIEDWGSLRTSMTPGDQLIFKKGLPIYYKDTAGNDCRATLDATYVYECVGDNASNTQVFYGAKLENATEYGLYTTATEVATGAQGNEQFTNIGFDTTEFASHSMQLDFLDETIAEDYMDIAGYTVEEAKAMGMAFRYIPNASTLQIGFGAGAIAKLEKGDQIILKKGLPATYLYNGTFYATALDADYVITITGNNGTNLTLTYTQLGTYSLTRDTFKAGPEGNYYFYGLPIQPDEFSDALSRTEGAFTDIWKDYITLSKHDAAAIESDGSYMRWYTYEANVFQGVRFYTNISFVDGEELIVKKGLPITYTTTENKTKTTMLDKDYGFVYSAATGAFTYDSSIVVEEDKPVTEVTEFGLNTVVGATGTEGTHQVFNNFITDAPFAYENYYSKALHEDEVAATYLDYSDCVEADTLSKNTKFYFVLAGDDVQVIQVQFTQEGVEALEIGDKIILKKGLPVSYDAENKDKIATLDADYALKVTAKNEDAVTLQAELIGTFSLADVFYHGDTCMDVPYGSAGDLADAVPMDSVDLETEIMEEYVEVSGETFESLEAKGYCMEVFTIPALRGLRINFAQFDLQAGDIILFKEGLPITYTTTSGKTKTVYLDDTYAYVKNTQTAFVYDASIKEILPPELIEFGFGDNQGAFTTAHDDYTGINIPLAGGVIPTTGYFYPDFMEEPSNHPYIQVEGNTIQDLLNKDFEVLFIPSAGVVQIVLGTVEWEEGMEITFKAGMTVSYYDGCAKQAVLDDDYSYQIVKENDIYVLKKANYYVSITVDGTERVADKYKFGTELDLSQYKNDAQGKVMTIKVNGVPTDETTLVVNEDMEVVIENRSDICVVVFRDNGKTCAVREYKITDKNINLPYAPDMDGYDDSWEAFELVNGIIYVDAVHTEKQLHPIVKLSGVVVEDTDTDTNQSTSPETGDFTPIGIWLICGAIAMMFVTLVLVNKKKKTSER